MSYINRHRDYRIVVYSHFDTFQVIQRHLVEICGEYPMCPSPFSLYRYSSPNRRRTSDWKSVTLSTQPRSVFPKDTSVNFYGTSANVATRDIVIHVPSTVLSKQLCQRTVLHKSLNAFFCFCFIYGIHIRK